MNEREIFLAAIETRNSRGTADHNVDNRKPLLGLLAVGLIAAAVVVGLLFSNRGQQSSDPGVAKVPGTSTSETNTDTPEKAVGQHEPPSKTSAAEHGKDRTSNAVAASPEDQIDYEAERKAAEFALERSAQPMR